MHEKKPARIHRFGSLTLVRPTMQASRWYVARAIIALGLVAITAYACTDQNYPSAPSSQSPSPGPNAVAPIQLAKLTCTATVASKTVVCASEDKGASNGVSKDLVYGGQNVYVQLTSSNTDYDAGTHKFTFNVTVRNLIPQAIGTTNGTLADPSGIKVFFPHDPTVTGGTGVVTVDNPDGVDNFTGPNQPYFKYVQLLDEFDVSTAKPWRLDVPPSVTTFVFSLYVSSPVQFPYGWVEVSHPAYNLRRTYSKLFTAVVYDQLGHIIPGAAVTWSSSSPSIASVTPDSGYVTGHLPGDVSIIATSQNSVPDSANATQTGAVDCDITGTALVWTAGAATTAWETGGNWDRGVSPLFPDSVTIPAALGLYPALNANGAAMRVTVADATTISLGAFNLTVGGDVTTGTTGGITNTSGSLILSGIGSVVAGKVPRLRVTGTYSATANITARAPIQVDAGRLTVSLLRLQADGT
jgi:hypothetical protein